MKSTQASRIFAALSHEKRLDVFRLLVQRGAGGVAATDIAKSLKIQPATLSFHLKELAAVGLVDARQDGRFIYYNADFATVDRIMQFLVDNCCGGEACEAKPAERRKSAI